MNVREIQSIVLGYELKTGEKVIDLYFDTRDKRIVLEVATTPISGKRKLYFKSKIDLLHLLFEQHIEKLDYR